MSNHKKSISYHGISKAAFLGEKSQSISLDAGGSVRFPQLTAHVCGITEIDEQWHGENVNHPHWILYYNFQKGAMMDVAGETFALSPKSVFILPANVHASYRANKKVPHLWIHFLISPAEVFYAEHPFEIPVDNYLKNSIQLIVDTYISNINLELPLKAYHLTHHLIHLCLSRIELQSHHVLPDKLVHLTDWIKKNPSGDLSNTFLAQMVYMSRESFIRWFKAHIGMSPAYYVSRARIDYSCQLLLFQHDLSIEQIAAKAGFSNRHYFSRVFALARGCGPARFRKQNENT